MSVASSVRGLWAWLRDNDKAREFIIYVVFLALFSVVTFASKPGEVQFYLNQYHGVSLGQGVAAVTSVQGLYAWLQTTFQLKAFPKTDPVTGDYLDGLERLYISGEYARVMGAIRVRQVRSELRECVVPSFLKEINGEPTICAKEYSRLAKDEADIFPEGSAMADLLEATNFSLPFKYQESSELNSTVLYGQAGTFGTYGQDGFSVDMLPNVAPNVLASYVSWCRPIMLASIEQCKADQLSGSPDTSQATPAPSSPPPPPPPPTSPSPSPSPSPPPASSAAQAPPPSPPPPPPPQTPAFPPPAPVASAPTPTPQPAGAPLSTPTPTPLRRLLQADPAPPPPPPPTPQQSGAGVFTSCVEDDDIENHLQGVDVSQCRLLPDPSGACQLTYVGFDTMRELMSVATDQTLGMACTGCKCQADINPICVEACAPGKLFGSQVRKLKDNQWLDEQSRAVMVDVALFNQNFNLFTSFRAFFELPTIGGVQSRYFVRTFRIHRYISTGDAVIMGLEFVFCAFILFYTVQEVREIIKQRLDYFKDPWNYMDWANLIILYVVIGLRVGTLLIAQDFSFTASAISYVDFVPMGAFATQELNISALNFFLLYFKVFKYLKEVPRMDAILVTISGALVDLLLFIIMAAIVLMGFAAAFYVCFGMTVADYRSLPASFGSLIQALLGVFDYNALRTANSVMAPLLFYLYFAVVFFVLLSMFIAILDDSYSAAKENQTEEDLNYYVNLKNRIVAQVYDVMGKKRAVHNLAQDLLNADSGDTVDGLLDEKELEAVLSKNPRALEILRSTNVRQLMEKYDTNSDGVLDKKELMGIIEQLVEEENQLEQKVKGAQHDAVAAGLPEGIGELQAGIGAVEDKVARVDGQLKDLSRNVAKKLSLMIDLMMSLSDQVTTTDQTLPGRVTSGGPAGTTGSPSRFVGM